MKLTEYIKNVALGVYRLGQGMYVSMLNFIRPKVTEEYPENRGKRVLPARMRGELIMPHDENNHHRCVACKICINSCPNGSISLTTKVETDEETGKEKKVLDKYMYDIGSCTFCSICVWVCPHDAITWSPDFEHSVFTRERLVYRLNKEGSSLAKKEKRVEPEVKKE